MGRPTGCCVMDMLQVSTGPQTAAALSFTRGVAQRRHAWLGRSPRGLAQVLTASARSARAGRASRPACRASAGQTGCREGSTGGVRGRGVGGRNSQEGVRSTATHPVNNPVAVLMHRPDTGSHCESAAGRIQGAPRQSMHAWTEHTAADLHDDHGRVQAQRAEASDGGV